MLKTKSIMKPFFLILINLPIIAFSQKHSFSGEARIYILDHTDSISKKYIQKAPEYVATLIIKNDNTFEYFYSNTSLLLKYSIGKIIKKGTDTLLFKSDTSLISHASNLLKKNKYCYQYLFQVFDGEFFIYTKKRIIEIPPYINKGIRKPYIKISSFLKCCPCS